MDPQRRCAPLREPRLDRLPPIANSWSASCHLTDMIAPTARGCKRALAGASIFAPNGASRVPHQSEMCRHGIVSGIIMPPHFRPATAPLDCDKIILRWPGPFGSGFLSPQPPGVVRIGPVQQEIIPILGQ